MTAEASADAIADAVERGRDVVIPQWLSFLALLKANFPGPCRLLAARFA